MVARPWRAPGVSRYVRVTFLLFSWLVTAPAHGDDAQPETSARALFEDGRAAAGQGNWSEAEALFRRSLAVTRRASTLHNLGVSLQHQNKTEEARHAFEEALALHDSTPSESEEQRASTAAALAKLETMPVATLSKSAVTAFDSEIPDTTPPPAEPAQAVVGGDASQPKTESIPLRATSVQRAHVERPSTDRRSFWQAPLIVIAGGSAALLAATVTGVTALHFDERVTDRCQPGTPCTDLSLQSDVHRAHQWATVTDVLLITGTVALAGGITWWWFDSAPPDEQQAVLSATATAGPGIVRGAIGINF